MSVDTAEKTLEENKTLVREFVKRIFVDRDLDAIDELVTDDFVDHVPLDSPGGPAGFRASMEKLFASFPDLTTKIEDVMGEGQRMVVRISMTGTQRGEFERIPPTNKRIEVFGLETLDVRDGKIAQRWMFRDEMAILHQLGMM
jgi:steroid delta-isomerase-like uncharacterized protein